MINERARPAFKRLTGSGPAPSVGFLTDSVDHTYQWQILRGARAAANERGANLLCFVGGYVMPAAGPHDHDWVYGLSRPANADGMVVLSGAIVHEIGTGGLSEFCARYRPLPLCSVAIPLDGTSSVCVDNEGGMRAVVEHLVSAHGLRRIGFVRGPPASEEAEVRLRAYRTVLESAGIVYDPGLVVTGDFLRPSGREATKALLGEGPLAPGFLQAIVACNDYMALGVLDELRERRVRVPDEIAVAGFDDCEEARFASPTLTTVSQPLEEQGADATRIVLEQIRASARDEQAVRRTRLVVRRSCGCLPAGAAARGSTPPATGLGFDAALLRRRQHVLADMARAGRGAFGAAGPQWDSRLLGAAAEQIRGDSSDAFLRAYDDVLRRLLNADVDLALCNDVLSAMRRRLVQCIVDPAQRTRAEDGFHEARIMTTSAVEGLYVGRHAHARNEERALMRAGAALLSARDVGELQRAVHDHLPALGIPRFFVLRLDARAEGDVAQLLVAERPDAKKSDAPVGSTAPATDALRRWVLDDGVRALVVFPVRLGDRERGLLVLELADADGSAYESLRQLFGAALARMQPLSG